MMMTMLLCRRSDNVKAGDEYTAVYTLRGMSLGRTDIVATAVQYGKKNLVTSDAREIQVCTIHVMSSCENVLNSLTAFIMHLHFGSYCSEQCLYKVYVRSFGHNCCWRS